MVWVYHFIFYKNNTQMRHFYELPQDDGSHPIQKFPPSHPEMALPPHYAQASARAPQPSQPPTPYDLDKLGESLSPPQLQLQSLSPSLLPPISLCRGLLLAKVSPYHQQGSTIPLVAPLSPLALACPLDPLGHSDGWMAPLPMSFGALMPSYSPRCSMPLGSMGGGIHLNSSA